MSDKEQIVRDTTAWTLGAVCELHPQVAREHLQLLMPCLVDHLAEKPAVASQVNKPSFFLFFFFFFSSEFPNLPLLGLLRYPLPCGGFCWRT